MTFDLEKLQEFLQKFTGSEKIILVNPNDIEEDSTISESIGEYTNYPGRYYEELNFVLYNYDKKELFHHKLDSDPNMKFLQFDYR